MTPLEIIDALRALPLRRRYGIVREAGIVGACCQDCGCYADTCHPFNYDETDCTCPDNPDNATGR